LQRNSSSRNLEASQIIPCLSYCMWCPASHRSSEPTLSAHPVLVVDYRVYVLYNTMHPPRFIPFFRPSPSGSHQSMQEYVQGHSYKDSRPRAAGGRWGSRRTGTGRWPVAGPIEWRGDALRHCSSARCVCTRKTTTSARRGRPQTRPACRVTAGDRTGARIVSCVLCVAYAMSERAHPAGPHQGAVQCTGAAKQRPLQTRLSV
jgi:hypothetical protein